MSSIKTDSVYTLEIHSDRKPIALLIHGMAGSHRALLPLAKCLTDYRVILLDLPGHGESEPLPGTPSVHKLVEWLNAYIATMPQKPAVVIGHSYGTLLTIIGAVREPSLYPALVACNPINYRPSARNRIMRFVYKISASLPEPLGRKIGYSRVVADLMGSQMFVTHDLALRKHLNNMGYEDKLRVPFRIGVKLILDGQKVYMAKYFKKVTVPMLAITSADDPCIDQAGIDALSGNAHIKTIITKGTGHLMPLESPERVAHMINDWLQ